MKRNTFLQFCISGGIALTAPFATFAKLPGRKRIDKGFKVDAGKDRFDHSITLHEGDIFYCKVSTKDTDGDMYTFESTRVKNGGPPLHYHFEQDEWWYILEGEFLFKVGEESFTAKAGDSAFGPRNVPHAFSKINDGNARMLIVFQPAGRMEEYFKAVSQGVLNKITESEKDNFRQAHGFKVVGPALTYDITKNNKP
jgi:mannose-6-phosphate isomerase-like protein (cupin superfamily)